MAGSDFDIVLKKEAKTSLQSFKDSSLLRRKFGDSAVSLYNAIGSGKPASQLMREIGIPEEKFVEMLEFMNNNAMVSVERTLQSPSSPPSAPPGGPGSDGERGTQEEIATGNAPPGKPGEEGEEEMGQATPPGAQFDEKLLSPLEKILFESYGELGVRVYNLIDGEKTAEEILKETSMSEAKLVEILEFMDEKGIIKLEKPEEKAAGEEIAPEGENDKPAREPRFTPISEDVPEGKPFSAPPPPPKEEKKPKEIKFDEPLEDIVLVDVPAMSKLSIVQKALLFAELSTKFGKKGSQLVDLVDGKRDFLELSLSTGLSLFDIDSIMAYFGQKGLITFRQLDRDEIRKRYGEDGFAIYKRYGRDGLLLYEMIGKEASLRDIISKSRIDPEHAINIFIFIHKVLGLDVPLDKDVIYRQLGLKK